MSYEFILTETRGRVALITLNRPKQMNALNPQLMQELGAAMYAFDADDGIGECLVARLDDDHADVDVAPIFIAGAAAKRVEDILGRVPAHEDATLSMLLLVFILILTLILMRLMRARGTT